MALNDPQCLECTEEPEAGNSFVALSQRSLKFCLVRAVTTGCVGT